MLDLTSPTLLIYIGGGSNKPVYGPVTLRRYMVGSASPETIVEEADAPSMLQLSRRSGALFRKPNAEELAKFTKAMNKAAAKAQAEAEAVSEGEGEGWEEPQDPKEIFSSFEGVGAATAAKLAAADYTVESLAAADAGEVAENIRITKALAEAAIKGAQEFLTPAEE